VKRLSDEIPGARFTIVGSALTAPLFIDTPGLAELIVMEKKAGAGHWFELWSKTRKTKWGLVVDLRGSGVAAALRPRRRAVHKGGGPHEHKVIEAARVLTLESDPPAPFLFASQETEARARAITAGRGPILAMAPAANWLGKTWPAERFALVARQLLADGGALEGGRLMVLGGPEDHGALEPVKAAVGRDRLIDIPPREELIVLYAALKRTRLFIGNDSGLMHLAAAAGVPTLGLFGPSDETLYAPWGPKARVVRGPRTFDQFVALDPNLNQAIGHMMDLSTGNVMEAAERLIRDTDVELAPAPQQVAVDG